MTLRSTLALAALGLSLSACQPAPVPAPPPGEMDRTGTVLQTVNGQAVTQDMLDAMINQLPAQMKAQLEATGQIDQMAEQLVVQEALYQKAVEQKLHEDAQVKAALAIVARSTLADHLIRREVEKRTTDAAIQTWYDDHAVQFARPQVQLAHIMVASEDEAKAIKAQLDGGADFAAVAKEKSLDARTKDDGGVLGWVRPKDVGPLGTAIEGQKTGFVSEPVSTPRGSWHVMKVLGERDKVPLEEVKDQIKEQLEGELADAYVKEVREAAQVAAPGGATVTTEPAPGAPAAPAPADAPAGAPQ